MISHGKQPLSWEIPQQDGRSKGPGSKRTGNQASLTPCSLRLMRLAGRITDLPDTAIVDRFSRLVKPAGDLGCAAELCVVGCLVITGWLVWGAGGWQAGLLGLDSWG